LIKAGGFDEQFSMAWREDSDLEFKLIDKQHPNKKGRKRYCGTSLYAVRHGE
jgi:hypothetical protein